MIPRRLVVTGTVMADILLYLDEFPQRGGAAVARDAMVAAGAGYNLLAGAARLGLPSAYAGFVGSGPFGTMVRRALGQIGVPVLLEPSQDEDTGFNFGLVGTGGAEQTTFIGWPGVESRLTLGDLRTIALVPGDAVYLSGYDLSYPDAGAALTTWVSELGQDYLLVFDPGPLAGKIAAARLDAVVGRADLLSLNAAEAAMLATGSGPATLAEALTRRMRRGARVVLRDGADGCWIAAPDEAACHVRPRPARPVDPTGAGDIHVATLVAGLANGLDLADAALSANVAASLAVEQRGASAGPTASELARAVGAASQRLAKAWGSRPRKR
jgi:sugar/nucleoside kinase (ribokinase family)